ncbi:MULTISPECIES: CopG family ribbon-helix-helix protein [unclassified Sphingopyxis]|uniref:CopG family ribbon-helix-helix protein n=1 Tax=unclassified Sphingopyxis TaxID=2614943 RepID=UPI00214B8180|nr:MULTISPECIES: ribbon-helix-helix protein, CopG family [unclassified Sphingopyxis]HEX2811541.1 ribbon-helix-helix protein, CopG family [Sphingopyxis sp.]
MTKPTVISTRVTSDLSARIDTLAKELDRSRAWVIAKAIERYIEEELEFIEFVREGERDIEQGRYFTQEQVEAMFAEKLGKRNAA